MSEKAKIKVSVGQGDSLSQQIIDKANLTASFSNPKDGKTVEVKRMSFVDQMRFTKALGKEDAENQALRGQMTPLFCVTKVDGIPVPKSNYAELEALAKRLGDDGYIALCEAVMTLHEEDLKNAESGEDAIEQVKK